MRGLNEAIAYEKGDLEVRTVKVSVDSSPDMASDKTWQTFLDGINGFTEDYFEILENRHNDEISSEREI